MGYNILFTGGAGYVGCKVADKLSYDNILFQYMIYLFMEDVFENIKSIKAILEIRIY